jgi:uncharacterized membrane protein
MKTLYIAMLLASASLISCTNGPNARTGTVVGGLGGAAVGGLIGGGLGALGGNVIGGSQDERNRHYYNGRRY